MDIGILQGRLSPSPDERLQFFPKDWEKEFFTAKEIGFSAIEWLFDWPEFGQNPIIDEQKRGDIKVVIQKSGVQVNSICADYYMKYVFSGRGAEQSIAVLKKLVDAAADVATQKLILIPLLETNAPKSAEQKEEITASIKKVLPYAEKMGVRIGFETEMPYDELKDFIAQFNSDAVGSYYDLGNAASYGFDCAKDIRKLRSRVFGIHAKDRKVNTNQSVLLGTGDAPYAQCSEALRDIKFSGTIIMQAWRSEDYVSDAKQQFAFLKSIFSTIS